MVPRWTVEPDLKAVKQAVEAVFPSQEVVDSREGVSALPLWKACDYPWFLHAKAARNEEPDEAIYRRYDEEDEDEDEDEEGSLYWEHKLEYELTVPRLRFLDEMRRLEPGWIEVFEASRRQRDFDTAAQHCDGVLAARSITEWVDGVSLRGGQLA